MTNAANLEPIMHGAEVMERTVIFTLCSGGSFLCDPSSSTSLDDAEAAIIDSAVCAGIDGRVMFTAARRQLGDIAVTRAAQTA